MKKLPMLLYCFSLLLSLNLVTQLSFGFKVTNTDIEEMIFAISYHDKNFIEVELQPGGVYKVPDDRSDEFTITFPNCLFSFTITNDSARPYAIISSDGEEVTKFELDRQDEKFMTETIRIQCKKMKGMGSLCRSVLKKDSLKIAVPGAVPTALPIFTVPGLVIATRDVTSGGLSKEVLTPSFFGNVTPVRRGKSQGQAQLKTKYIEIPSPVIPEPPKEVKVQV